MQQQIFKLEIATGNDAFKPDARYELAQILRNVADKIEQGKDDAPDHLFDCNGNCVGHCKIVTRRV